MSRLSRLARIRPLRRVALSGLYLLRGIDLPVRHPWAGGAVARVNAFRHKGFWFHRRTREAATMQAFTQLLPAGGTAFDVGAHIGWVSMQFAHLVGPNGRVLAFEPGANNLPYLRRNLSRFANATIIEAAVGAEPGEAQLFEESLTGQNNALGAPYHRLAANAALNPAASRPTPRRVAVTTLDAVVAETGLAPGLVKIDVEGHELPVLQGAAGMLEAHQPVLMVEVTRDQAAIAALLGGLGYRLFAAGPAGIAPVSRPEAMSFNVFALPPGREAPWPGDESPRVR